MNLPTPSPVDASTASLQVGAADIPVLGFGTYGLSGTRLRDVLVAALRHGFRHIDTTQIYRNEAEVGEAIRLSGIPRSEVFSRRRSGSATWCAAIHGIRG